MDYKQLVVQTVCSIGESRWQARPISERDLAELRRKAHLLLPTVDGAVFAFWSRGDATRAVTDHPDVRLFTPEDLLRM